MRELNPFRRRQELLQVGFDLHRIGLLCEPQQPGDPPDMSIDDDSARDAERGAQQDIRRLATDAWQFDQFVERLRDFAAMFVDQLAGHLDQK